MLGSTKAQSFKHSRTTYQLKYQSNLVRIAAPEYKSVDALRFRIEQQNEGFYVDTNIDFNRLNESYHKVVPAAHSTVTEAYILALLQGAYEATYFAGTLNSEVAVAPIERVVQAKAVEAIVRRHKQSESQIESFLGLAVDALGAGGLGTAANVALSAVDSFLADKLIKGWKPHQFVEGDLKSLFDEAQRKKGSPKPPKPGRTSVSL